VEAARSDWLLVAPPQLRPADGWIERLATHLREGGGEARLEGAGGGLLRRAPAGVIVRRAKAKDAATGGLERLLRRLGRGAARLR
jgi:hypothetical protein